MPRRNSKAASYQQLVRFLRQALEASWEQFEQYTRMDAEAVRKLAAKQPARKPGRPKRGSRYDTLVKKVDELRARRKVSRHRACQLIADKAGVSAEMLRKRYRLTRPN